MPETDPFSVFIDRLNSLGVRYAVSGDIAGIIYGEPRLTRGMEIVLDLNETHLPRLQELFPPDDFYCPPPQAIRVELARRQRGRFTLIHQDTGYKADIDLPGENPLDQWALENVLKFEMDERIALIAPPEYVVLSKLELYRECGSDRLLTDIRGILQVSGAQLNREFLARKIVELSLEPHWRAI
jgi:hypothetical protein